MESEPKRYDTLENFSAIWRNKGARVYNLIMPLFDPLRLLPTIDVCRQIADAFERTLTDERESDKTAEFVNELPEKLWHMLSKVLVQGGLGGMNYLSRDQSFTIPKPENFSDRTK